MDKPIVDLKMRGMSRLDKGSTITLILAIADVHDPAAQASHLPSGAASGRCPPSPCHPELSCVLPHSSFRWRLATSVSTLKTYRASCLFVWRANSRLRSRMEVTTIGPRSLGKLALMSLTA